VFLQVEGQRTKDVVLRGNSLARVRQPLQVASDVPPGAASNDEPVPNNCKDYQA
jgi:hypothetical protein